MINFLNEPPEFFEAVISTLEQLFARHTKAELYQAALDHLAAALPRSAPWLICAVDEQLAFA